MSVALWGLLGSATFSVFFWLLHMYENSLGHYQYQQPAESRSWLLYLLFLTLTLTLETELRLLNLISHNLNRGHAAGQRSVFIYYESP